MNMNIYIYILVLEILNLFFSARKYKNFAGIRFIGSGHFANFLQPFLYFFE